ncbi:MAG: TlpA family protein disulfide reductase [Bryobacter sp.]|jgi:peroxiredoxin|nr:TlpA family protein disulfide reductase [Bryobacter sp. CoA8 C33]
MKSILVLALASCALFAANEYSGRRAPSFSLPDVNMRQHDILDYRGKVLIVEFMQTKCDKCQALTKSIEGRVKPKFGDNVAILSIVVPPDTFDDVKKYTNVFKVSSPILFDMGQVAGSYVKASPQRPAMYFPHVFLIDQKGEIRADWQWTAPGLYPDVISGDRLITEIEKLLAEGKAAAPATPAAPAKAAPKPAVKK